MRSLALLLLAVGPSAAWAGGVNVAPPPSNVIQHPIECLVAGHETKVEFCFTWYGNNTPNGKVKYIAIAARVYVPADGPPINAGYVQSIQILHNGKVWANCDVFDHLRTGSSTTCSISGYKKLESGFTVRLNMGLTATDVFFMPV